MRCAPRGIGVDIDALRRRDGAPAREGARVLGRLRRGRDRGGLVRAAREASARPSSSATRPRAPKAWSPRWCSDGKEVADARSTGESGAVVLNQTPFYGESGGQVGDTGVMTADGVRFRVTDTQKKAGDLFVHHRHGRAGHAQGRRRACARGRSRAPQRHPRATTPRRICCTRRCARCSAITSRRRARWSRPTGCASTSRIRSR